MAVARGHLFPVCSAIRQTRRPWGPFAACTRERRDPRKRGFRKRCRSNNLTQDVVRRGLASQCSITDLGPFGEVIRASGPMAKANPFRFSTKYQDDESDLLYYGYRYYNASTGRWPSRDPIGEDGGLNLYTILDNDPTDLVDLQGLSSCKSKKKCGLIKGPEYDKRGTIAGGTPFRWTAKFKDDSTYSPSCCEIHQYIKSNKTPLHSGFPPDVKPDKAYEDRDKSGKRYGHRTGRFADPQPGSDEYSGDGYSGADQPFGWPAGTTFKFYLVASDVCNGSKIIYTSRTLIVKF